MHWEKATCKLKAQGLVRGALLLACGGEQAVFCALEICKSLLQLPAVGWLAVDRLQLLMSMFMIMQTAGAACACL